MKKLIVVPLLFCFIFFPSLAFSYEEAVEPEKTEKEKPKMYCPTTLMTDNDRCMSCHVMSGGKFTLKETKPDAHVNYPTNTKILNYGTDEQSGLFELYGEISNSNYDELFSAMDFFTARGITHITMEIYSYGGGLLAAWRTKGLIDEWIANGNTFHTKVLGAAISAAAVLFATGQERIAHAQAEIMFHELWTFKFFDLATPSDKEEEARILRHLQDTITDWLTTRCNKTKEELDDLMKKKEYWLRGKEAYEIGLATKLIGG